MARKTPEINSSSQADIAFLLLCFFLMTTSMDVDYGITRRLPPPVEQNDEDVKVKERNVMNVMVNKSDRLRVNGRPMDISLLKDEAKHFMTPRPGDETAPEVETKTSTSWATCSCRRVLSPSRTTAVPRMLCISVCRMSWPALSMK